MSKLNLDEASEEQVREEIRRLQIALDKGLLWPRTCTVYLHSNKETMYGEGEEIGLEEEAQHTFAYTLYEVEVTLEVHKDGNAYATHINKVPLTEKVSV